MKLDFRKAPSFSAYDEGTIYFETSTHAIKVGTGNNAFEMYSGVRSAKFDSSTKVLTVVNEEGVDIVLILQMSLLLLVSIVFFQP